MTSRHVRVIQCIVFGQVNCTIQTTTKVNVNVKDHRTRTFNLMLRRYFGTRHSSHTMGRTTITRRMVITIMGRQRITRPFMVTLRQGNRIFIRLHATTRQRLPYILWPTIPGQNPRISQRQMMVTIRLGGYL